MKCGTRVGRGTVRGAACRGPQASGSHRVCFVVPDRAKVKASDAVITSMVSVYHRSALVLFDPGTIYSYVSAYFASDLHIMYEPLSKPICVSTLVSESLVVNRLYQGCAVTFMGRDSIAHLILLDMVDFDMILGMDWLSPLHAILDCHAMIGTLSFVD